MKKHIPNVITLLNLFCGVVATIFAANDNLLMAAFFVIFGIIFDFFDGFAARILDVKSELGLQLDSLADMVTSGLVPGIVLFKLFEKTSGSFPYDFNYSEQKWDDNITSMLPLFGLMVTLASCYRLAKFNIDTRQTDSFIGLPTPANTLFILSLPLILLTSDITWINDLILNKWFLVFLTIFSSYILNAELPLFSLKFKSFSFKENALKYLFLIFCLLMLVFLNFLGIPLIIFFYVMLSIFINLKK